MSTKTDQFDQLLLEKTSLWNITLANQTVFNPDYINFESLIQIAEECMRKLEKLFNQQTVEKDKLVFSVVIKELIKSKTALEKPTSLIHIVSAIVNIFSINAIFNTPEFLEIEA